MREIKLCNEKLSLATTSVSGRERSHERAYSRKRIAWDQVPQWGKKAKNGVRNPFNSLDYLSARFARRFFFFFFANADFFSFFPQCEAWSQSSKRAALIMTTFLISEVVAYESFDCAINTYPICDLLLEFGAVQLRIVREIAPKSLFLRVNRILFLSARRKGNMNVQLVLQHCCKTS